jgi:hypothetical protein
MVTVERPKRRSDDPRELRDRYNELCHALTQSAGTNSAAADRLLAELQGLAQQIAAAHAQAEAEAAQAEAPRRPPKPSTCCTYRPSNVVAFRLKVKASSSENPRLPAALSALTESYSPGAARAAEPAPAPSRVRTPMAALAPAQSSVKPIEPTPPPTAAASPAVNAPAASAPAAPPRSRALR